MDLIKRFRPRTKRFRPPPTHPLKRLKDKDFRRVFFNVLSYIAKCRVRQAFVIVCGDWEYVNFSTPIAVLPLWVQA